MYVTILGSAAKQSGLRECTSILVDYLNQSILFDVGPGIVSSLYRTGRKAIDVNHLILTHVHGDHISGFGYFIFSRRGEMKQYGVDSDRPITVYGYEDTINLAKTILGGAYPNMSLPFSLSFVVLNERDRINLDRNSYIDVIPAIHAVPTISSIIEAEGKKIIYSSDTLISEELVNTSQNADLVIHEGMYTCEDIKNSRRAKHATALDAGKFAAATDAKNLVIVHIDPKYHGNERKLLAEVASVYNGSSSIPFDGSIYHV